MNQEVNQIKKLSFLSVASLLFQSSYSAVLGFAAFFILTLKSGVHLLGIYNTVLAMMSFFNYFTNLGLAAAIIQKKQVEEIDLNTAFFIQFILSGLAVIVGFFITGSLFRFYKDLPPNAVYLYWAILFSFFILSLKTVPSVLLEKKIQIYKVVLVQAIENTLFYACVIIFSLLGWEIYSLVIAVVVRSIFGTLAIYVINPWFPKPMFSLSSAKTLLKYGIPFQGNSFLALIKDDLLIIYLGSVIGMKNLGFVTFAKKYGEFSIRLVMDNINRVAFPVLSRFQNDPAMLKKGLEKILFYITLLIFPIILGTFFIFNNLLQLIPGYFQKWQPALFSFYFFSLSALLISLTTPFINLFNAIGKLKYSLGFMVLWTVLSWILVPISIRIMGFSGISVAFFVMSLTFIFVYITAKKYVDFSFYRTLQSNLIAVSLMVIYLIFVKFIMNKGILNLYLYLIVSIVGAVFIYLLMIGKRSVVEIWDLFIKRNQSNQT